MNRVVNQRFNLLKVLL